jgi:putative copper export protein
MDRERAAPRQEGAPGMFAVRRVLPAAALLAIAVWLGGLVALGAIAAPVVFSIVPWPSSADAMSVVFRRFDAVAMTCAAVVLATEAVGVAFGLRGRWHRVRAVASLLAAAAAVFEGVEVSPRIVALHAAGAIRGVESAGHELARLHDLAEWCGKTQVVLLATLVALHAINPPGAVRAD